MAGFKRFEEIEAWQIARKLNLEVYRVTGSGPFARDFGLRDQIRRASISVSSNIAEGFARRSPKDFARFLTIARASAAEVCSQLYLALDLEYVTQDDFDTLYRLAQRSGGSCSGQPAISTRRPHPPSASPRTAGPLRTRAVRPA